MWRGALIGCALGALLPIVGAPDGTVRPVAALLLGLVGAALGATVGQRRSSGEAVPDTSAGWGFWFFGADAAMHDGSSGDHSAGDAGWGGDAGGGGDIGGGGGQ